MYYVQFVYLWRNMGQLYLTSDSTFWHYPKEGMTQSREVCQLPGSCGIVPWCLSLHWLMSVEPLTKPIGEEDEKLLTRLRRISQQSFCEDLALVLPRLPGPVARIIHVTDNESQLVTASGSSGLRRRASEHDQQPGCCGIIPQAH